jgi:hypothetical protein
VQVSRRSSEVALAADVDGGGDGAGEPVRRRVDGRRQVGAAPELDRDGGGQRAAGAARRPARRSDRPAASASWKFFNERRSAPRPRSRSA